MSEFKGDQDLYKDLLTKEGQSKTDKLYVKRHILQLVPNIQYKHDPFKILRFETILH